MAIFGSLLKIMIPTKLYVDNFNAKSPNSMTFYCTKIATTNQNSSQPTEEQFNNEIRALEQKLEEAEAKGTPPGLTWLIEDELNKKKAEKKAAGYSQGGLVDYTGLAVVHGSQSKPEAFLNASQTAQITEALRETTGKESVLEGLRSTMDKLRALVHNISTIDNSNNQNISIAPGAVVIQVEQLADSYDIDEVSRDVMNRMVTIANKATNRGVSRR